MALARPPEAEPPEDVGRKGEHGSDIPKLLPEGPAAGASGRTCSPSLSGLCGKAVVSVDPGGNEDPSFIHHEWIAEHLAGMGPWGWEWEQARLQRASLPKLPGAGASALRGAGSPEDLGQILVLRGRK